MAAAAGLAAALLGGCGGSLSLGFGDWPWPYDQPPVVSLSASPLAVALGGRIVLNASAVDDFGVLRVEFLLLDGDGTRLLASDTDPPYQVEVTAQRTGVLAFRARAVDTVGQLGQSNVVEVTVGGTP